MEHQTPRPIQGANPAAAKPTSTTATADTSGGASKIFTPLVMIVSFLVAFIIYRYVLGAPGNFEGGDNNNHPVAGNYLGVVYKGGFIVPILIGLLIITLTFFVERLLTIGRAKGKGNMAGFVREVKIALNKGDVARARQLCNTQRGSLGNVVLAGLNKYEQMNAATDLDKDSKVAAIQKEIDDATTLELPMLERNLVIISTIASVATLIGLLGTVFGMVKAFAALATAGAPDAVALANGISEALINTALGIGTSALAIIFYNYFTSTIDSMTYNIDEAGYSITQTFAANHRD